MITTHYGSTELIDGYIVTKLIKEIKQDINKLKSDFKAEITLRFFDGTFKFKLAENFFITTKIHNICTDNRLYYDYSEIEFKPEGK